MKFVLNIGYEAGGRERLNAVFFELNQKLRYLRPLWANYILPLMPWIIERNFASYGLRIGEYWPRLTPEYEKRKNRLYPGNPINVASGYMKTAATKLNAPGNYVFWPTREGGTTNPTFMIYGIDKTKFKREYPKYVQGLRPFIGLSKDDRDKIWARVADWLSFKPMVDYKFKKGETPT